MKYSEDLESMIASAIAKGAITDQERNLIVKKALIQGVDPNELEIYINSLLQKRQQELEKVKEAQKLKYEQDKKEAFGQKCPNCGAQVPPLTLKCECGYEFTSAKSVSSVQIFSDKLQAITSQYNDTVKRNRQIRSLITAFPVPNTKEDIIEFLSLAAPYSMTKTGLWKTKTGRIILLGACISVLIILFLYFSPNESSDQSFLAMVEDWVKAFLIVFLCFGLPIYVPAAFLIIRIDRGALMWNENAKVWRAKFEQVLMKGRTLRGDPDFQRQLDYFENIINKK